VQDITIDELLGGMASCQVYSGSLAGKSAILQLV
jgi:hypothetical protein